MLNSFKILHLTTICFLTISKASTPHRLIPGQLSLFSMEFIIKLDEQETGNTVRTFAISKYLEVCREPPKWIKRTKTKAWGGLSCSQTILGFRILHYMMPTIYKRKKEAHKRRGEECFCCVGYVTAQQMIPDRGKPALSSYGLEILWCFGWRETGTCLPTHVLIRARSWLLENKLHISKECTKQGLVWVCSSSSSIYFIFF